MPVLAKMRSSLEEEYAWLEGGQPYVACAFYTPNYIEQITSLKRSLEAQGINHFFKRYQRGATWEATTRLKPVFVDYALKKFPEKGRPLPRCRCCSAQAVNFF